MTDGRCLAVLFAVCAAIPLPALGDALEVDSPQCLGPRHRIEQAGVLTFDRFNPQGSGVFFQKVGDVDVVLSCGIGTDPSLSLTLDDWKAKDPLARTPPKRLLDLVASQGALATNAPARVVYGLATRCMQAALADHDGDGEIHAGEMEIDCSVSPGAGGLALFNVSRHPAR